MVSGINKKGATGLSLSQLYFFPNILEQSTCQNTGQCTNPADITVDDSGMITPKSITLGFTPTVRYLLEKFKQCSHICAF